MEGQRSAIYVIRWEILVMVVSLILVAILLYTVPHDYSDRLLKERETAQKALKTQLDVNTNNSNIQKVIQP
jgi:hypothetical protein